MWHEGVKGLMTVLRVLPEKFYDLVMHGHDDIPPGAIFEAIAKGHYRTHNSVIFSSVVCIFLRGCRHDYTQKNPFNAA